MMPSCNACTLPTVKIWQFNSQLWQLGWWRLDGCWRQIFRSGDRNVWVTNSSSTLMSNVSYDISSGGWRGGEAGVLVEGMLDSVASAACKTKGICGKYLLQGNRITWKARWPCSHNPSKLAFLISAQISETTSTLRCFHMTQM